MKVYEFADFRLEPQERLLYREGKPIQLAPKVFDTLLALVSRYGQLVSKETLIEEIWGDYFVEENNLTQYIFTLRRMLGERKDGEKFIETVPRKGYRFTAPVVVREFSDLESKLFEKIEFNAAASNIHGTPPQFLTEKADNGKPDSGRNRRERYFAIAFIVLLIAISLGFAVRYEWRQDSPASDLKKLNFKRLTETGNLFGAVISPDGNSLAYVAIEGKKYSVRLRNIATESEIIVVPPVEALMGVAQFSPDGNFIYYSQSVRGDNGTIYKIPVLGGEPLRITENLWSGFSVSPDGRFIAFPRKDPTAKKHHIIVAATDGSGERIAASCDDPDYYALWGPAPAWSPDGEHLTAAKGAFGGSGHHLVEISLADASEREIKTGKDWDYIEAVAWAGKDELLIAGKEKGGQKTQLWRIEFPNVSVERLTNDFNAYITLSLAKDERRLVTLMLVENIHLWYFDKETGATRQLTSGENRVDGHSGLAFAPDGQIVFTARNKNEYDIFSLNPENNELRQLTKNAGRSNTEPIVSPDNEFIAFISNRTGIKRLWLMKRDGSDAKQLTPPSEDKRFEEHTPYFSPDGKWIYYTVHRNGHASIRKITLDGSEQVAATSESKESYGSAISPDGKFLAFSSYDDKAKPFWRIGVRSLAGGEESFFYFPAFRLHKRWTPDSQSLISIEHGFHGANLWQTNLETGERYRITNFNAERIYNFDISRDGRSFILSRGNGFYDAVLIER